MSVAIESQGAEAYRLFGSVVAVAGEAGILGRGRNDPRAMPMLHDVLAVVIVLHGEVALADADAVEKASAGDALVLSFGRRWSAIGSADLRALTLLLRRQAVPMEVPNGTPALWIAAHPGLAALTRLVDAALRVDAAALSRTQARLVGDAIGKTLAAALVPVALGSAKAVALRNATLLERVFEEIDARLDEELDATALCAALGCSRSTLYRAVAPVSGIAELIGSRRIAAVHRCLLDPRETRPIRVVAAAHGFRDAAHFSRKFKQTFGLTARHARSIGRAMKPLPMIEGFLNVMDRPDANGPDANGPDANGPAANGDAR